MTILAFSKHLLFCAGLAGLSALVVRAMIAVAVLDQPDARKAHAHAVPKGGGVGVVVAFLVGTGLLYAFAGFARVADSYFLGTILAATAIAAVAFLDDLLDWPFTIKLGAQILAALVAVASGLVVTTINLPVWGSVPLGWLGVPVTLAWILFATNAMNFIDGLNGLASGVTCLAAIVLAIIAATLGGWFVYFASLLLAAGLVGSCRSTSPVRGSSWAMSGASSAASCWPCSAWSPRDSSRWSCRRCWCRCSSSGYCSTWRSRWCGARSPAID